MAALLDWQDEIAKSVKGIDNAQYSTLLEDEIRDTIRNWCHRTGLWWVDLDRITTIADQPDYDLSALLPSGNEEAEIEIIESVKYKEDGADDDQFRTLDPIREWVENQFRHGSWNFGQSGDPYEFFYREFDTTLFLNPPPENGSTEGLLIRVVLKPTHNATEVPDFFYNYYKTEIGVGVVASLMHLTNKPWSNEQLGDKKKAEYDSYVTMALQRKQSGYTKRRSHPEFPHFGGSRSKDWVF